MESRAPDPPEGSPDPARSAVAAEETLRRLQLRLDAASAAAEQLIADASRVADAARLADADGIGGEQNNPQPPSAGWQPRNGEGAPRAGSDVEALIHLVQSLRHLVPPEVERRLAEAVRELLLAVRALIDWYVERLDLGRDEPPEVQDIPIV